MKIDYYFWKSLGSIIFWMMVLSLCFYAFFMAIATFGNIIFPVLGIPYIIYWADMLARDNRENDRKRYDI